MITLDVTFLKSVWSKSKGLLGEQHAYPAYFTTHWGIHTFGIQFPIDVLILDDNGVVVKHAEHVSPNKIFTWPITYYRVVELPAGEIQKRKIIHGKKITLHITKTK